MKLKWIVSGAIVAACAYAGYALADTERRRVRLLEELISALKLLRIQVVNLLEPVDRALESSECSLFSFVAKAVADLGNVGEAWKMIRDVHTVRGRCADSLRGGEISALDRLFERLGQSGREAQDEAIKACVESLRLALDDARENAIRSSRLYTSVATLTGMMIAVLMM